MTDLNQTVSVSAERKIGFADFGDPNDTAVLWCHGGPGSRLNPAYVVPAAAEAGFRLVGIDRPGYGLSTPQPGRTIEGWVEDALAVADRLRLERFVTVGTSTGGAYALAVAALAPGRAIGAVACCSVTDMRYEPARETMSGPRRRSDHVPGDRPPRIRRRGMPSRPR